MKKCLTHYPLRNLIKILTNILLKIYKHKGSQSILKIDTVNKILRATGTCKKKKLK